MYTMGMYLDIQTGCSYAKGTDLALYTGYHSAMYARGKYPSALDEETRILVSSGCVI